MFKKSQSDLFCSCEICETPNGVMYLSVKRNPQIITIFQYVDIYAFRILSLLGKINYVSEIAVLPCPMWSVCDCVRA